jgi:hypothetical protein
MNPMEEDMLDPGLYCSMPDTKYVQCCRAGFEGLACLLLFLAATDLISIVLMPISIAQADLRE